MKDVSEGASGIKTHIFLSSSPYLNFKQSYTLIIVTSVSDEEIRGSDLTGYRISYLGNGTQRSSKLFPLLIYINKVTNSHVAAYEYLRFHYF